MGWLDRKHRRKVRKKYHVRSFYFCDAGNHPIPIGGLIVIDPRKGYFPWPSNMPPGTKQLTGREPKWCSCYSCDMKKRNHHKSKRHRKEREFLTVQNDVLEMIKRKPKSGYWSKEKVCEKSKHDRRSVLRAIRVLRKQGELKKRDGGYLMRRES